MSKEKRISIRLSDSDAHFLTSHPFFSDKTITQSIELCIEKVRHAFTTRHTLLSNHFLSDDEKAVKNLFLLYSQLDFSDRLLIASQTELKYLDQFYSIFGFRFDLPCEYDADFPAVKGA